MAASPDPNDPSQSSSDADAMANDWAMIADILAGAATIKQKRGAYLPQRPKESKAAYDVRLAQAPWRPEFEDALRSICAKPFTKEVVVNQDAPEDIQGKLDEKTKKRSGGYVDDIDGQGNSLHVFARDTFWNAVGYGLDAIYVTWPAEGAKTRAEEKAIGVRPYWVHIRGRDILACTFRAVGGRQAVEHIRWRECGVERRGFIETVVERVRVLELDAAGKPVWQLYKKDSDGNYAEENKGVLEGVAEIPVALFFTGMRSGSWRVKPPLIDLAVMQFELYRALSGGERIISLANSPMLVGAGFAPPSPTPILDKDGRQTGERPAPQIEVGPGVVLFAPPSQDGIQPSWEYIAPQAANIEQSRKYASDIIDDFRRLALQPSTPKSGNMVATGQAIDAAKSHSAVEAWANGLADVLNQALMYTMQWLKKPDTVTAVVHTDFGVDLQGGQEATVLGNAQGRGVISAQTEREELARRGILGPQFDEDEEIERIAGEQEGLQPEVAIDPVTGQPIPAPEIDPLTGKPKASAANNLPAA